MIYRAMQRVIIAPDILTSGKIARVEEQGMYAWKRHS
jgi:hypothetical protein